MKNRLKRTIAFVLIVCMLSALLPEMRSVEADGPDSYTLANGNIEVTVSAKNGGFIVRTKDGDKFNKDDNNKRLLFHNGEYDTSFTSFQVTEGTETKEYIFGGNYSFLGLGENDIQVREENGGIVSTWSVDDLTFNQIIQPVWNEGANEHGTIAIYYTVENGKDTPVSVKARLLLDTALEKQDYAYYEMEKAEGGYNRIENETVIQGDDIPANFFAYDNYNNPTITAFTISDTSTDGTAPYKAAFGHWNNLGATVFDFVPDPDMTFTSSYNKRYLTADSAYALYYDLGMVPGSRAQAASFLTYYGIYSNVAVAEKDSFSVNITAPSDLELNTTKDMYIGSSGEADGKFTVTTNIGNIDKAGAVNYKDIAVAAYVDEGFYPLENGVRANASYNSPYWVGISNFAVGETKQLTWDFDSEVFAAPGYRKITFKVYNLPESANNTLLLENLIGSASTYVLCPGGDGRLPEIIFTGSSPEILYFEGTRHFYLTGSGFNMLKDTSRYVLKAYPKDTGPLSPKPVYTIPSDNIIFTEDDDGNPIIDVVMTEKMELGNYYLVFEWETNENPAGIDPKLTAPALEFAVSDDPSYKNDYYGIVAIVKTEPSNGKWEYHIKTFPGEVQLKAFKDKKEGEILLELRGEFNVIKDDKGNPESCSAVTVKDTDTININGVLDVTKGDVRVTRGDSGGKDYIYIDMEGELLTSYSRTPVWTGVAHITPLIYGEDIGLVAYDDRGEKKKEQKYLSDSIISLQWSSEYKILQTIGGMVVDLRYGEFGKMYEDDGTAKGYVLSFGASLDVSKLMPKGKADEGDSGPLPIEAVYSMNHRDEPRAKATIDTYNKSKEAAKKENEENKTKPVGKVNVEDILYGLNSGYMGFNAKVELTLPKYVDALPELGGSLEINTINGYSFGVAGKAKAEVFELEFELRVKSAPDSGAPVPDKIYFHIAGFEPGVNIDSVGVLWLTGGGGGIDKLYDTIFSSGLPPLTLLLTVDFDLLKVMSARADLSLSLRGFKIKVDDVKLKKTDITVIKNAQFGIEWYPDFYLLISASIDLLKIIHGSAYLVVDNDFFEFFLRVGVSIPEFIPLVGGMLLAQADLGASSERIWGAISLLSLKLGICYYWGGDFSFGTGDDTIQPTYPELLGFKDIPVGYDEETGRTLYMRVGTNLSLAARAEVTDDLNRAGPGLMGAVPSVKSNAEKKQHLLNLGTDNGDDFAFSIAFPSGGPSTIAQAEAAVSITKPGGSSYPLIFYREELGNAETANANLIYDGSTGKSSVNVTITDHVAGDWEISTDPAADIVLYNVAAMPEVASFTAQKNGGTGKLDFTWAGSKLDETKINFYVTSDIGDGSSVGDMGTYIGSVETPAETGESLSLGIPADLKTGDYYVRMTVSKETEINDLYLAEDGTGHTFSFHHENPDQPDPADSVVITNSGNLMFDVDITDDQAAGRYDGYLVNVYEWDGSDFILTDLTGLIFEKDAGIEVGGTYTDINGNTYGLEADKDYAVGVTAYKAINPGAGEQMVFGDERISNPVKLALPDPPEISFRADADYRTLQRKVKVSQTEENTFSVETFTTNDVEFALIPDETVLKGSWYIDSTEPVQVNNVTTGGLIIDRYLPDGDHTVTFEGKDAQGDSFLYSKIFSVDTTPPRLMLTSPTNGSFFGQTGKLKISGVTDTDALFTILVDGQRQVDKKTLGDMGHEIGNDGTFSFDLETDQEAASHRIEITVEDEAGNSSVYSATVINSGLADVDKLDVLKDGLIYSNNNIRLNKNGNTTAVLSLMATTGDENQFILENGDMVNWEAVAREGSVTIDEEGLLTVAPGSVGLAVARLHVADSADMTAAVTFGAEAYHSFRLIMASTPGGTVTAGEGSYLPGDSVRIRAVPNSGYRFAGWSSSNGGSFADASSASTIFTMPENDTTVTASFVNISREDSVRNRRSYAPVMTGIYAEKGQTVSVTLTPELLEKGDRVVPYYMLNGKKYIVTNSMIIDGKLVFIAPVEGEFGCELSMAEFQDTAGHWANRDIDFVTARGLFNGVGGGLFDPNGGMTRGMFITVLSRLEGADISGFGNSGFSDVAAGSWYDQAIGWGVKNKIVSGLSGTSFAPDEEITREQMAVMLYNYIMYKGYGTAASNGEAFGDMDSVSSWAKEAVKIIQGCGIMGGRPGNIFDPRDTATRAEGCAVFRRLIEMIVKMSK